MPIISQAFPWQGIVIILAGAFLRSLYVINNKRNLRGVATRFVIVVNMLVAGSILFTALVLTGGLHGIDWFSWPGGIFWPLITTMILNLGIQPTELKALQLEDASLVSPMSAAAPLFSLATGFLILRELPTAAGWFGVILLSVGSYILNISKPAAVDTAAPSAVGLKKHLHTVRGFLLPWFSLGKSRGVRLALLGAVLGSIAINFDKMVATQTSPFFLTSMVMLGIGFTMLTQLRSEHVPSQLTRQQIFFLLLSPLLWAAAATLFVVALSFGLASYSSALRRAGILFVVLLAGPLLKERGHPERIWGGAIMAVGAVLLAL